MKLFSNLYSFSKLPRKIARIFSLKVTEQVKVNEEWNVFYADCLAARNDSAQDISPYLRYNFIWQTGCISSEFYPGDKLIIHAPLMRTPEPVNPGDFNYQELFLNIKESGVSSYLKDSML